MKVVHVITCLEMGGAETMLHRLLSHLDRDQFQSTVVSLTRPGPMAEPIKALGVPVRSLHMRHGGSVPYGTLQLARMLRQERPAIVQTWMYHADLVGGAAAWLAGGLATIWNIRHGALHADTHKRTTLWTMNACAWLSRHLPARIICCSRAAWDLHTEQGYDVERMVMIPNGFDVDAFRPDPAARREVRQELGLPAHAMLIGLVARFDPDKDHRTFLQAAARLQADAPDVHFVLCGDEIEWTNQALVDEIDRGRMRERCHLLGRRDDIHRLQASFDIATLSSISEGFPNVVGEAMACGVPCVVTDVGDAAWIVGETGRVVPPRDPAALAAAWRGVLTLPGEERRALERAARDRVLEHFALPAAIARYEALYKAVAHGLTVH